MALRPKLVTAAAGIGVMLAPVAMAESEMAPQCHWDAQEQRFIENKDLGRFLKDHELPAWVAPAGTSFVSSFINPGEAPEETGWLVLHHCASGRYIVAVARPRDFERVGDRFHHLIETSVKVTMDDIAVDLAGLGAGVRRGQGDIGTCDCNWMKSVGYLQ